MRLKVGSGEFILFDNGYNGEKVTAKYNHNGVEFSNGYSITDYHDQDCCESVYADWSSLDDTSFVFETFTKVVIRFIENVGFRINDHTINCYNEQNGYYSEELSLIIEKDDRKLMEFDITDYKKDCIY